MKKEITSEIITLNYYLLEAVRKDDKKSVQKYKILLDNLIKIYLENA